MSNSVHKFISLIVVLLGTTCAYADALQTGEHYVTTQQLAVHMLRSEESQTTSTLYKRDKVDVHEVVDGWARISEYFDTTAKRDDRKLAQWVNAGNLSTNFPPVDFNSPTAQAIKSSDYFSDHGVAFVSASERLLYSGQCTLEDFKKTGGWWRATNIRQTGGWLRSTDHLRNPLYFTYCGGEHPSNAIYLNPETSETFR